jgi:hypothetical protein
LGATDGWNTAAITAFRLTALNKIDRLMVRCSVWRYASLTVAWCFYSGNPLSTSFVGHFLVPPYPPPPVARRWCYIQVELLEILHLLEGKTPAVASRSKEIECCDLFPGAPPMHPVVSYDAGVSQHQAPRGNVAWFGAT